MAGTSCSPADGWIAWNRQLLKRPRHVDQARDAASIPCAIAVQTDVTSEDSVRNLFARTQATFGRLDLLFNNAGISGQEVPVEDLSIEVWQVGHRHQSHRHVSVHSAKPCAS